MFESARQCDSPEAAPNKVEPDILLRAKSGVRCDTKAELHPNTVYRSPVHNWSRR